jgi:hypothetical protein
VSPWLGPVWIRDRERERERELIIVPIGLALDHGSFKLGAFNLQKV